MAGTRKKNSFKKREKKTEIVLHVYIYIHDTLSMGKRKAEEEIEIGRCRGVENFSTRGKTSKSKQTEVWKKRKIEVKHCVPCAYIKINP